MMFETDSRMVTGATLLALGFVAGSLSSTALPAGLDSGRSPATLASLSEGNRSAFGQTNYIQAPYADPKYQSSKDSVTVDVSSVSFPEGKSMQPTIFSGNMALLQRYDGEEIEEGQILRYTKGDSAAIHRVQANYLDTGGYLLMRGDNNRFSERIEKSQITHRVVGILYTEND